MKLFCVSFALLYARRNACTSSCMCSITLRAFFVSFPPLRASCRALSCSCSFFCCIIADRVRSASSFEFSSDTCDMAAFSAASTESFALLFAAVASDRRPATSLISASFSFSLLLMSSSNCRRRPSRDDAPLFISPSIFSILVLVVSCTLSLFRSLSSATLISSTCFSFWFSFSCSFTTCWCSSSLALVPAAAAICIAVCIIFSALSFSHLISSLADSASRSARERSFCRREIATSCSASSARMRC
mmetsp:Transcript_15261/g.42713  ORF Transcript_15261/g.42713 Transcript_15261/m.42713 type:complete len:246 (-) Transcript_15261:578-1315(-)